MAASARLVRRGGRSALAWCPGEHQARAAAAPLGCAPGPGSPAQAQSRAPIRLRQAFARTPGRRRR
eukprot:1476006-Alexandrium_andersonii.AAC.2